MDAVDPVEAARNVGVNPAEAARNGGANPAEAAGLVAIVHHMEWDKIVIAACWTRLCTTLKAPSYIMLTQNYKKNDTNSFHADTK